MVINLKLPGKIRRLPAGLNRRRKLAVNRAIFQLRSKFISGIIAPAVYGRKLQNYKPESFVGRKPRILLLRNRFAYFENNRVGDSYDLHTVAAPLKNANVAEVVEYFYDLDHADGPMGDSYLANLVERVRPDLMVFSAYSPLNKQQPNFGVLKTIRAKCKIPIVMIWCDSIDKKPISQFLAMSKEIDLNLLMDSETLIRDYPNVSQHIRLWTPNDTNVFYPLEGSQDIDVSFIGSTESYRSIRTTFLEHVKECGIALLTTGGQHTPIGLDEYAEIMRKSKISINFSHSIPGTHQLKARVFEILLSRSLLMESANPETPQFFRPMIDYVEYGSKEDLAEKIRYYLEHDEERNQIAQSGFERASTEYSHTEFWNQAINRLEELNLLPSDSIPTGNKTVVTSQ